MDFREASRGRRQQRATLSPGPAVQARDGSRVSFFAGFSAVRLFPVSKGSPTSARMR